MNELKPCPFCGGEAEAYETTKGCTVMCSNGDCVELQMSDWSMSKAVSLWNKRAQHGEWVSVKDRLPIPIKDIKYSIYLTIHNGWDTHCRILMFDNETLTFTRDGDDTQKITHWMPLPTPPKEK